MQDLYSSGFPFSKQLRGHTSCVNATCWSHGDVQWLATAGDDRRVLLWNMHQDDVVEPTAVLPGARSNTFTLAFSASNSHIISGGADETARRFDISQLPETHKVHAFDTQEGSIRAVSAHPTHDELFLSASEDGTVVLHDSRIPSGAAGAVQTNAEFTGCQYHPHLHDLFLTTDSRGRCFLRDARMAFVGGGAGNAGDAPGGIVRQYVTTLSRRCDPHITNPEASSVVFDGTGEKFAVIFQSYYPTIYTLSDEYPFAVCTGKNDTNGLPLSAGTRTYANCCTMKHGSFGGPGNSYFATGSDDFRGYVWRIPDPTDCLASRRVISGKSWAGEDGTRVGFAKSGNGAIVLPASLDTPAFRLCGHNSLINSVLLHPHAPLAVTSGVESYLRLHGPVSTAGYERTATRVREVPDKPSAREDAFLRALHRQQAEVSESILAGDAGTIAFFDEVVREESGNEEYIFTARAWGNHRPVEGDDSDSGSSDSSA